MAEERQLKDSDFQPLGSAWSPFRPDIEQLLEDVSVISVRPIYYGSNHTFLTQVTAGNAGISLAVYKPARGEYPLYDFPAGTLYKREVATWLLDVALGWGVVPPTVVCKGPHGVGSLQLFIEARDEAEVEVVELQRIALLDVLANNADRKGEHCLVAHNGKLWGIDHGLTFNAQPKLRTVLWHFAGKRIPRDELRSLQSFTRSMERRSTDTVMRLCEQLSRAEADALLSRARRLVAAGTFPDPRQKSVPYRW